MTLTPEQQQMVSRWVAAGDSLSTIQKKLLEELQVTMTFMEVRFLVDDLNLAIKDAPPRADASDVSKGPAPTAKPTPPAAPGEEVAVDDTDADYLDEDLAGGGGAVRVTVDAVTLIPGAMASGAVTFSDGVTGKWIVDNYGRPGFTEISQPGYRPSAADSQAFVQELSVALQQKGL